MDLNEIGDLLEKIAVHYPGTMKNITDRNGGLDKRVCEEWQRVIGFLDFDEALSRLDAYMNSDDSKHAPNAMDFRKVKSQRQAYEYFHSDAVHVWYLSFNSSDKEQLHGRLYNEDDMEYVHDPVYEDGYHYNSGGDICTADGRTFCPVYETANYIWEKNRRFRGQVFGMLVNGADDDLILKRTGCHAKYPDLIRNKYRQELKDAIRERLNGRLQEQI